MLPHTEKNTMPATERRCLTCNAAERTDITLNDECYAQCVATQREVCEVYPIFPQDIAVHCRLYEDVYPMPATEHQWMELFGKLSLMIAAADGNIVPILDLPKYDYLRDVQKEFTSGVRTQSLSNRMWLAMQRLK